MKYITNQAIYVLHHQRNDSSSRVGAFLGHGTCGHHLHNASSSRVGVFLGHGTRGHQNSSCRCISGTLYLWLLGRAAPVYENTTGVCWTVFFVPVADKL